MGAIMDERNYIAFVLGYDLMHDAFDGLDCDYTYETCLVLAESFMQSEEYNDLSVGTYEALQRWLDT